MKEQLISYVELLFAGSSGCEDMKQEILQNTLERYDDLILQGKTPEAAYRLSISGIGDIQELLQCTSANAVSATVPPTNTAEKSVPGFGKRLLKAIAILLYIISLIPMFVLDRLNMGEIGLCGMLVIWGVATALLIVAGKNGCKNEGKNERTEKNPLCSAICTLIAVLGTVIYFIVSFLSGAWHITWVIFPMIGAIKGLIRAIFDLLEVEK